MITLEQFSAMIPSNKEPELWYEAAVPMFEKYEINTNNRIAGFMAQCAHESLDFTRLVENLNYSEKALNSVFGRYFGKGKRDAKNMQETKKKSQTTSTKMSLGPNEVLWETSIPAMAGSLGVEVSSSLQEEIITHNLQTQLT